jgi:hypothetical protein
MVRKVGVLQIISVCMCLHNFIHDSKLFDDYFNRFECAHMFMRRAHILLLLDTLPLLLMPRCVHYDKSLLKVRLLEK